MEQAEAAARGQWFSGGKSELDRARWSLTATRGNPRDSATENTPPMGLLRQLSGKGEMVR